MVMPTSSTTDSMLDAAVIHRFATALKGRVILPDDRSYESARRVWNWAIDLRPGLIVQCANSDDVIRAIDFARRNEDRVRAAYGPNY
jgi:hypothetical protein